MATVTIDLEEFDVLRARADRATMLELLLREEREKQEYILKIRLQEALKAMYDLMSNGEENKLLFRKFSISIEPQNHFYAKAVVNIQRNLSYYDIELSYTHQDH